VGTALALVAGAVLGFLTSFGLQVWTRQVEVRTHLFLTLVPALENRVRRFRYLAMQTLEAWSNTPDHPIGRATEKPTIYTGMRSSLARRIAKSEG
jgi:hypothetical protein